MAENAMKSEPTDVEIACEIGLLDNPERGVRKEALERLWKRASSKCPQLRRSLSRIAGQVFDTHEICRELSLKVLGELVNHDEEIAEVSACVVPMIVQKLTESSEPSEELRLLLVSLLKSILEKSKGSVQESHLKSTIEALGIALLDQYPEVKKQSCSCICLMANAPTGDFKQYSEALIDPLLSTMSHQHSAVRVDCLYALGATILRGNSKSIGKVWQHVVQRLMDSSPIVRQAAIKIAGDWILELPDRQCYYPQLISIIMTGLCDDVGDVVVFATTVWEKAGLQYEHENEVDDFRGYNSRGSKRPLGCQILVRRNLIYLLPAVFNDLKDWRVDVRLKAAILLHELMMHSEEEMTQYAPTIIDGMICACNEYEPQVTEELLASAYQFGFCVSSGLWCSIILEKLEDDPSLPKLRVLTGMMEGCKDSELKIQAAVIMSGLLNAASHHTQSFSYQGQILVCVEVVLKYRELCQYAFFPIFQVLIMLLALGDALRLQICSCFEKMSRYLDVGTKDQLFALYVKEMLTYLVSSQPCGSWTVQSREFLVFKILLMETGHGISDALADIFPIMVVLSQPDKDAQLKFYLFQAISHLSVGLIETEGEDFALLCLRECVLPNLDRCAGKAASVARAAAVSCLYVLLQRIRSGRDEFLSVFNDVTTKTYACLTGEHQATRLVACQILDYSMLNHAALCKRDDFHILSTKLAPLLGDGQCSVRAKACQALGSCLRAWMTAPEFDERVHGVHLEEICDGLLLYLDDPEVEFQRAVLETLKIVSQYEPDVVCNQAIKARKRQKNQDYLDELVLCSEKAKMK